MSGDLYRVLDVPASASQADIKAAFRRLAVRYHPDISKEHNCAEKFAQINAAYETLADPAARATYDIQRMSPVSRPDVQYRSSAAEDPIYEMLRRHRKRHRAGGGPFTATSSGEWRERERWWQKEKQEAADYLERRQRLSVRMQHAHTSRIAKALSTQWPAQTGITRYDMVAASVFTAGVALMSSFWLAPVEPRATGGASGGARDGDGAAVPVATAASPERSEQGRANVTGAVEARGGEVIADAAGVGGVSPFAAARLQALEDALRSKASLASRSGDTFDESLAGVS